MQPFVHLHVHSQFSLLDGQASIKGLVDKAMADGMPGIALTDHGAMFGIKEFFDYVNKKNGPLLRERKDLKKQIKALEEQEERSAEDEAKLSELREQLQAAEAKPLFKPILGCEVYCARRSRFKKDANVPNPYRPNQSVDNSGWHLVLLAKDLTGYKNLIKMVSRSWIDGYYYRPRIDKELLEAHHEGIIASSACLGGEIPQHIMYGNIDEAEKSIEWFKGIFGDDFYLELQRHKTDNPLGNQETYEKQQQVNAVLLELGKKHGVKVIATNDVHFLNEEDAEAHDRLICLSTGKDLNDTRRMRYSKQEWLKTTAEMNELFADLPEVLATTLLGDHRRIDLTSGDIGRARQIAVQEALIVTDVEIGLGAILGDEHLAVLERVHGARIHIEVRVELLHRYLQAPRGEELAEAGSRQTFTERRHHTTGDEKVFGGRLRVLA